MISSVQSIAPVQVAVPPPAEVRSSSVPRVAESENLKPSDDVVEFREAGAIAQIIVAIKTRFNESQRLVDIVA